MRTRPVRIVPAVLSLALVLSGCGGIVDSAKSQVGAAVTTATCSLVAQAKTQVAALGDADPASLDGVSSAVGKVTDGLTALGSKVPAGLQDQLTAAKSELDAAIAQAKTDPATAKASLTAAGDKITASLDQLSTALSC